MGIYSTRHLQYHLHVHQHNSTWYQVSLYHTFLILVPTVPAFMWTHITLIGPTIYIAPTGRILPTANLSRLPSLATMSYGSTRPGSAEDKFDHWQTIFVPSLRFQAHNPRNCNKPFIGHLASCTDSIVLIYDFEHLTFEIIGNSS